MSSEEEKVPFIDVMTSAALGRAKNGYASCKMIFGGTGIIILLIVNQMEKFSELLGIFFVPVIILLLVSMFIGYIALDHFSIVISYTETLDKMWQKATGSIALGTIYHKGILIQLEAVTENKEKFKEYLLSGYRTMIWQGLSLGSAIGLMISSLSF